MRSLVGIFVVAAIAVSAACTQQQFGTGPVPAFADAGATQAGDASPDAGAGSASCATLSAIRAPKKCNGDFGSGATDECPAELAICAASGECTSQCDPNICTQGTGHAGPLCEVVGLSQEDGRREQGQCGMACDASGTCAAGAFCSTGIGRAGGVCLQPLMSGTVFGIGDSASYASCADAGAVVCSAGKAFGLNESQDFQGWCVCGSPPGTVCAANYECSNFHCNADKKCGAAANEACTPLAPFEIALLPEMECRTTCSKTTCKCEPECKSDADCGGPTSGRVCNGDSRCVGGCRGTGGNGCASSFDHCTSRSSLVGICTDGL